MSWWGKLVGGALGFSIGGPLGALIAGYLGHCFVDNNPEFANLNQDDVAPNEYTQAAFFSATFAVMGHLAKADGHVSKDEIEMAEQVMGHFNLDSEQRKAAIALFNQGKSSAFELDAVMMQFAQLASRKINLKRMFIEIQLHAVYADGDKHPAEHQILQDIAQRLGFSERELQQIEAVVIANLHSGGSAEQLSPQEQLKQAYDVLGVNEAHSMAEIKRAYRRMMSQHHPDKLVSKGLPEEMIKMANEKTQQIKKAYELIKKHSSYS